MVDWKRREEAIDGYRNKKFVASIYTDNNCYSVAIITKDGYMFIFNPLPDLALAKNVCELALNVNLPWEWWLKNQEQWWYEHVSQI